MLTTLALTAVLTAAPSQNLELKNVRTTYGVLGQERKDDKYMPGDVMYIAFDIEGLKVANDGRVLYAMGMELAKKGKAKPEFKRDPQDLEAFNNLGGSTLPAFALSVIGQDTQPGDYTLKITVKDRSSKAEKTLAKTFEVVKPTFSFVQVRLTTVHGEPVPPLAVPGQRIYVHYALVGFDLGKDKLPNVTFELVLLDSEGKPTLPRSFKGDIKDDLKGSPGLMPFRPTPLELNRAGKFVIQLKAKDNVTGKTTEQKLDLTVVENK